MDSLYPTQGSEIAKTRPCVVASLDNLNPFLRTVVVIPVTSTVKQYPWRVDCVIQNKNESIAVDQVRVVDKTRLSSKIGNLHLKEIKELKQVLQEMFID